MNRKESIRQSVLWAAYGDALGFITEFCTESSISSRIGTEGRVTKLVPWKRRVGGKYGILAQLPSGCYSDDTQLRLATSRAVRGDGFFDVQTFSKVELPIWLSYSLGGGRGTKTAAKSLKKKQVQWYSNFFDSEYSVYINGGGNGAAMRIQPHVWSAPPDKKNNEVLKDVVRNTIVTHGHSRAIIGAAFHAISLRETILTGNIPGPSGWYSIVNELRRLPDIIRSDEELSIFWLPTWEKETGLSIREAISGTLEELHVDIGLIEKSLTKAMESVDASQIYRLAVERLGCFEKGLMGSAPKTALLALFMSHVFQDKPHAGLVEVVNLLGSDTDTIATMAGAIMGAMVDTEPPEKVVDAKYLTKEAERLWAISEGLPASSHPYPDLLFWCAPVNQVDVIGKNEGEWVMQGFGKVSPGEVVAKRGGNYPCVWQWFNLEFGQGVLVKRRNNPKVITSDFLPVKSAEKESGRETEMVSNQTKTKSAAKPAERQSGLWDRGEHMRATDREKVTVDNATDQCIHAGFKEEIVGKMLMKLIEQESGIENAIAFAAIIAKAKQARMRREDDLLKK